MQETAVRTVVSLVGGIRGRTWLNKTTCEARVATEKIPSKNTDMKCSVESEHLLMQDACWQACHREVIHSSKRRLGHIMMATES